MDTKSKSTNLARGVFSWICFLLVTFTSILCITYFGGISLAYGGEIIAKLERSAETYSQLFNGELRELDTYKENASAFFQRLYYSARSNSTSSDVGVSYDDEEEETQNSLRLYVYDEGNTSVSTVYLESISKDNLYRVTDYTTSESGVTVTNASNWDSKTLPEGFNYFFHYENGVVSIFFKTDSGALQQVFDSSEPGSFYTDTLSYTLESIRADNMNVSVSFAVRAEATSYYASNEIVGSAQSIANQLIFQLVFLSAAVALFLLVLILAFLFRADRKLFETYLAHGLKWIWIELKLLAIAVWSTICFVLAMQSMLGFGVALCALFFMFYLLGVDISHNRRIYRHNVIHSVLQLVLANKHGRRFERMEYHKYMATVGVLIGLLLITVLVTLAEPYMPRISLLSGWSMPMFYLAMAISAIGTLVWFAFALRDDLRDYGKLMEQVEQMYNGDLNAINTLPPTSVLYDSAMQLNMIRDGIKLAVEEGIKSERTKVDLITNVSHDIKTPLTSIITYVELLKSEPDLPPHIADYVQVIAQKSDRLRHMLQDIFDVSKAATGNITLQNEYIRLDKLLQQTLADMETTMEDSPLEWRVQITDTPCSVYADGQRLYRVFQNLIKNAAQYSLGGSRVYISLAAESERAVVTMQNISKYEMKLDGESLTARFVRGDDSRTTSGSGLGLSIAKSFTEACGGTLRVDVRGDLFTAEIALPLKSPPEPEAPKDESAPDEGEPETGGTSETEA